jgi:hypothetical protein
MRQGSHENIFFKLLVWWQWQINHWSLACETWYGDDHTHLHIIYKSLSVSAIAACMKIELISYISEPALASIICVWCHSLMMEAVSQSLKHWLLCLYTADCLRRFCCIWSLWKLQMWYRLECVAMTYGKKVPDSQSLTGVQAPAGDPLIP